MLALRVEKKSLKIKDIEKPNLPDEALVRVLLSGICNTDLEIARMNEAYRGHWYNTLTFGQKTTYVRPDGTRDTITWFESIKGADRLRIDFDALEPAYPRKLDLELEQLSRLGYRRRREDLADP